MPLTTLLTMAAAAVIPSVYAVAPMPPSYAVPPLPPAYPVPAVIAPLVTAPAMPANASATAAAANPLGTTTEVVATLVTWCPAPTVLTYNGNTYAVESATTLTITDCPCTVTRPVAVAPTAAAPTAAIEGPESPAAAGPESPAATVPSPWGATAAGGPAWVAPGNASTLYPTGAVPPAATPVSPSPTNAPVPFANGADARSFAWMMGFSGGVLGLLVREVFAC